MPAAPNPICISTTLPQKLIAANITCKVKKIHTPMTSSQSTTHNKFFSSLKDVSGLSKNVVVIEKTTNSTSLTIIGTRCSGPIPTASSTGQIRKATNPKTGNVSAIAILLLRHLATLFSLQQSRSKNCLSSKFSKC